MPAPRPTMILRHPKAAKGDPHLRVSTCPVCRCGIFRGGKPRIWCPPGWLGWIHTECATATLAGALLEA